MKERYIIPEQLREINADSEFEKLGGGFAFPLRINEGGNVRMSEGVQHVKDCVKHVAINEHEDLYGTATFGGNVPKALFGVYAADVLTLRERELKEALESWEPRITDVRVTAGQSANDATNTKITMLVQFGVQATGTDEYLYYPGEEGD
jgi:hypothetical protein